MRTVVPSLPGVSVEPPTAAVGRQWGLMNISKPATMPDGRILVTCFGDPLPPPARGTHFGDTDYSPPPDAWSILSETPALRWSRGRL